MAGKFATANGSIYVCNLPFGTDEDMLAEYFGTIGVIKKDKRTGRPKIWLYRDKETHEPKGDATVTYEDPHAASAAVEWFNNKDFHGNTIGVFIAESKNKDDQVADPVVAVAVPVAVDVVGELEETDRDINGGSGRGRGQHDASGKPWQQEGDWMCPNTSCSNVNFAFRGACNRCGSARPAGAAGAGGGGGRGKGRAGQEAGGIGRPAGGGLFGPNDWPCPMCGNINWAKRMKCNICNTNKPGHNEGGVRGGRAGGYKELDEEEIEETKRRRREAEDDGVDGTTKSQTQNPNVESSFGNRAILVDSEDVEESESSEKNGGRKCSRNDQVIVPKVFMYDMPSEFHFGLLDWKPSGKSVWPDVRAAIPGYAGGLNLQHSIEFWLTLDILASEISQASKARTVIRVRNSSDADIVFVPFFSSLSYNKYSKANPHEKKSGNKMLQEKLVKYLTAQEEWKRSGGKDHVILAHHPNSMLDARMQLWPATFILSDFGRYPPNIASVEKDVIAPYKHLISSYVNDASNFDSRPTLLYFQGAIYRKDGGWARQELYYLLKDENDVHFSFGSIQKDGVKKASEGMRSSKFCLNIAGDTPSSNRLFDAIASHCVPVIISDEIELPFEDVLDYSEFCIFVPTRDAIKEKFLINFIRSIGKKEWTRMWNKLKEVEHFFEYHFPSKEGDAVQMIWQAVARKVPAIRLKLNKDRRFSRFPPSTEKGLKSIPTPRNFW